jgi:hypothetical protein
MTVTRGQDLYLLRLFPSYFRFLVLLFQQQISNKNRKKFMIQHQAHPGAKPAGGA